METASPYENLATRSYWRSAVAQVDPHSLSEVYTPKFSITSSSLIATAGSCFAQHIARHLRKNGYQVLDTEPAPLGIRWHLEHKYGHSVYSARYGNIYTVRQLLQLAREVSGEFSPADWIWEKDGRFYDALRPSVEPEGLLSPQEVEQHRKYHLSRVRLVFEELDVLVFTLGLTEMWLHRESGTVFPTAPGTIAGRYDEAKYEFHNAEFGEMVSEFNEFQKLLWKLRNGRPFRVILTVSPVPLTATASGNHVLVATAHSKALLRAVAGQLASNQSHIDYFPSYEIVTNPKLGARAFEENLRSVRESTVQLVMAQFFAAHPPIVQEEPIPPAKPAVEQGEGQVQCEDALLEAFEK